MQQFKRVSLFFQVLSIFLVISCGHKKKSEITFKPLLVTPKEFVNQDSDPKEPSNSIRIKSFKIEKVRFKRLQSGKLLPQLTNAKVLSPAGRPRIPMLSYVLQIPKKQKALLKLEKPKFDITEDKIELTKAEMPLVWSKKQLLLKEPKVGDYFPGKLFESHQINDKLYVSVYPMQVETRTGKVLSLVEGTWALKLEQAKEEKSISPVKSALIVTSEKLLPGAKAIQKFHKDKLSVDSDLITVETIAKETAPIDEGELPDGYKTPEDFERVVKGYDFVTAKKVISFLRKRSEQDASFKYVVLVGNSENVPPSYYFSEKNFLGQKTTGVTDQCYSAGKLCLDPRLAVGRLPFATNKQIENYLNKVERWLRNKSQAENELALYGGKAFPSSPFYIGELGTLVTVNREAADWKGTKKYFQTDGQFSQLELKKLISGDEKTSLVYYLDHGLGNRWYAGEDFVSSSDILNMESKEESLPPLVVSVSCINGAFDEELMVDDTISDREQWGSVSVGTALLRSSVGAIAYLGGARDGLGSPETEVDENGNVEVLGTTHGLQLFDGFVEKYREGNDKKVGDVLVETLNQYAKTQGNDMDEFSHRWTYWITEFMGDPLLPIKRVSRGETGYALARSQFVHFDNSSGFPQIELEEKKEMLNQFPVSKAEGPVTAKVFELQKSNEEVVGEKLIKMVSLKAGGADSISFDGQTELTSGKQYLIKLTNDEGSPRERHVVFSTLEKVK